jgi:DNA-binding NarL/FixJ family response regulator
VAPPGGEVVPDVRVLIVDDQEPYLQAMGTVVAETDGFVVVGSATSGEDALLAASRLRPDLVLMDVHLPGMDGIEATRRLTARAGAPVVLLLSTYDESHFDLSGAGAAGFIAKATFGPDRLSTAWAAASDSALADLNRVEPSE